MRIRNKSNGVVADLNDELAGVLVAGGGWDKVEDTVDVEAAPVKRPRKRVAKSTGA